MPRKSRPALMGEIAGPEGPQENPGWVDPEHRTTEQELAANSIAIERTKKPKVEPVTGWIGPRECREGRGRSLGKRLSLTKSSVFLGKRAADMIGFDSRLLFMALKVDGVMCIGIKIDPHGYKLSKTKAGSIRIGTVNMCKQLIDSGVKCRWYRVEKAKDGFIAMPEVKK